MWTCPLTLTGYQSKHKNRMANIVDSDNESSYLALHFFRKEPTLAFKWVKREKRNKYIVVNPFTPSGLFYRNSLDKSISYIRSVCIIFIITAFHGNPCIYANSGDPNQTPRSAASVLGLHCLPKSLSLDARHKWVKRLKC